MIRKSLVYEVCICQECEAKILYRPAAEPPPPVCPKCNCPANISPTTQQRQQAEMRQQQQGQNGGVHFMRF